jgi:hypothetical protein
VDPVEASGHGRLLLRVDLPENAVELLPVAGTVLPKLASGLLDAGIGVSGKLAIR